MNTHVYAATAMATDKLTDEELAAIGMVALTGSNPKGVLGYDKVHFLFTECGGTKMRQDTLEALEAIIQGRLEPAPKE